ncbi:unnamed protein product [Lymnaea stagnalis]|uniref:CASAMP N-terminal domain-containing protein n=1 Tax=Lymnaea stagnalis TaxID=6523 RepID=A0AAV2I5E6_LYMST
MATNVVDSPSCEFVESDVIEIIPADEYDSNRAKLRSSLSWLLSKVYGSNVPKELQDPFYQTAEVKKLFPLF